MKFKFLHEVINIGDWVQSQGPNHAFFLGYVLIYVSQYVDFLKYICLYSLVEQNLSRSTPQDVLILSPKHLHSFSYLSLFSSQPS